MFVSTLRRRRVLLPGATALAAGHDTDRIAAVTALSHEYVRSSS